MRNIKLVNMLIVVLITTTGIVGMANASPNENHSDVFVNSYIDNDLGFYRIEPFYVDYDTHSKVPVNMVTVSATNLVLNEEVILEWVNTASVPLTIEVKDDVSGIVVFSGNIPVGYETTYKFDTIGVYDVRIVEYSNLKHQLITTAVSEKSALNPPEVKSDWSKLPTSPSNVTLNNEVVVTPVATPYVVSSAIVNVTPEYKREHIGAIITPTTMPYIIPSPTDSRYPVATYNPQLKQPCGKAVCVSEGGVLDTAAKVMGGLLIVGSSIWNSFGVQ